MKSATFSLGWVALGLGAVGCAGTAARADLSTKAATVNNVTIQYKPTVNSPAQTYNLGNLAIGLTNLIIPASPGVPEYDGASMQAAFTVNTGAGAPPADIFKNIQLRWYQSVNSLPPYWTENYNSGNVVNGGLPISDPPLNGWDYMYTDLARTKPDPNYVAFIDDLPFYFTRAADAFKYTMGNTPIATIGSQYVMRDNPQDVPNPGGKGADFFTYLVGETQMSTSDPLGLEPGQMLVLAGFEWHNESNDINIDQTFMGPGTTLANVNSAIHSPQGGFPAWNPVTYSGWEAVGSAVVVPEPASLVLLGMGVFVMGRRRKIAA